jgi:hypothetical protein
MTIQDIFASQLADVLNDQGKSLVIAVTDRETQETKITTFNMEGVSKSTVGQAVHLHLTQDGN